MSELYASYLKFFSGREVNPLPADPGAEDPLPPPALSPPRQTGPGATALQKQHHHAVIITVEIHIAFTAPTPLMTVIVSSCSKFISSSCRILK